MVRSSLLTSLLSLMVLAVGVNAWAADEATPADAGQSTLKIEETAGQKNKVDGNIDEEIVNAKMRAESGSKSKFSLSSSLGYTGGSFSRPFGKDRPNLIAGEPGNQERTSADIGLDARYRWSKSQSVTLGTSAALMTPFQGNTDKGNQLNVLDPVVGYNLVGKIGGLETSGAVQLSLGTSQESKGVDKDGKLYLTMNALKSFKNGLAVGLAWDVGYNAYNTKPGQVRDPEARAKALNYYGGDKRTEWNLGIYPFAEYAFNDTFSARTVFGYFNWRHVYGDTERYRLLQSFVYQSVGVGISVTRDIYLYPNVQFVPDNIRGDFTNLAMSATLNVF